MGVGQKFGPVKVHCNKLMMTEVTEKKVDDDIDRDSGHATDSEEDVIEEKKAAALDEQIPHEIVWPNIVKFVVLHSLALYGLTILPSLSWKSWVFLFVSYQFSGAGITAGAHRLWSHRTYKARAPLRLFLAVAKLNGWTEFHLYMDS